MVRLFGGLTTPLLFVFVAFQTSFLTGGEEEERDAAAQQCAVALAKLLGASEHAAVEGRGEPVSQPASQTRTQGNSTSVSAVSVSSLAGRLPATAEEGDVTDEDLLSTGSDSEDDGRGAVFKEHTSTGHPTRGRVLARTTHPTDGTADETTDDATPLHP